MGPPPDLSRVDAHVGLLSYCATPYAKGEYCLCQRVKPEVFAKPEDYVDALKAHHAVMQMAMKAKQTVDVAGADALEHAVEDFSKMYTPK